MTTGCKLAPVYLLPASCLCSPLEKKEEVMPKVKFKPMFVEIQGTMYEMVFKKSSHGNPIVTRKPDMSKVKWSPAQKQQRKRFKVGVAAVQAALREPRVRRKYERKAKRLEKRAWDLAMSDYFAGKDLYKR